MKNWRFVVLIFVFTLACFGWNSVYPFLTEVRDIEKTIDGNYIACGSYLDYFDYYPARVMKFRGSSDTLWTSSLRFPGANIRLSAIAQRSDSSFVAVGYTDSTRFGDWDVIIFWLDKNGVFLRHNIITVPCDDDYPTEILALEDNDVIISSWTEASNPERSGRFIIKADSLGNVYWRQRYGIIYCRDIIEADEGYIFCGGQRIVKINDSGEIIWSILNSNDNYDLEPDHEGTGFVVCGRRLDNMVLSHYNYDSTHVFTRSYGGSELDFGLTVSRGPDSSYYLGGGTESFTSYGMFCTNVYSVKVDLYGDTLWTNVSGGESYDFFHCCVVNDDGSVIFGGTTMSWGYFYESGYVVRLNNEGVHGSMSYLAYDIQPGWNLLSLPVMNEFPISEFSDYADIAYKYSPITRDYYEIDTICSGDCFWLLSSNYERAEIGGEDWIWHTMDTIYPGWNLIFSPRNLYETELIHIYYPEIIFPIYSYNRETRAYDSVDSLLLGKAYWVLSSDTCLFEIP